MTALPETKKYRARQRRAYLYMVVIIAIIALLFIYSLAQSSLDMTFMEAYTALYDRIFGIEPSEYHQWLVDQVVYNDNLPRTIAAVFVGIILAVSGTVMQSLTRNPLADPYTIGISSAALLGVSISIICGISIIPGSSDISVISNAFIMALIPSMVIIFISSFKKMSPTMMVLIGIGIMYIFSAFTMFLKINAEPEQLEEVYEWGVGTLTGVGWSSVLPLLSATVMLMVSMMILSNRINVLSAGDSMSVSLGVDPLRLRVICFVLVSVAVAVAVCFTGTIGFVGLVGPHIARLFVGSNTKRLIPASALIGVLMVLGADVAVRMIPGGLPAGVVTAIIGSPLFIFFLYRQRKQSAF